MPQRDFGPSRPTKPREESIPSLGNELRAAFRPQDSVDHYTFTKTVNAELAAYLPGVKRLSGNTVLFTAKDMTEASKFIEAVTGLNTY